MAINLSQVNFSYEPVKKRKTNHFVLKDIDLKIEGKDEFIAIVGHTGSGKSTLAQILNALLVCNSGVVDIFGKVVSRKKKVKLKNIRQQIGLVFQFPEYQLFEETILKDVMFGPKNFKMANREELAKKALETVGISPDMFEESPFALSGGQMRRVAIAGILASNPDVLIFDEPTVGLDPLGKKELLDLLKKLNEEEHKSIIIITHDMEVVSSACKRVIVLDQGIKVFDGEKDELFKNDELIKAHSLDYPNSIKILKEIKEKLNIDINIYQYTIEDAFLELKRVLGDSHE